MTDLWPTITQDREILAEYLSKLDSEDWKKPSLCERWNVRSVALHLLVVPTMTKGQVFLSFAKAGFSLDKMSDTLISKLGGSMSDSEIVNTMRSSAGSKNFPPGLNPQTVLGEVAIHSLDIAEAVGTAISLPAEHIVLTLDAMKSVGGVLKNKQRIAGLALKATDVDWQHGAGPAVEGRAQDLLLAMSGRKSALSQLTGDGVQELTSR